MHYHAETVQRVLEARDATAAGGEPLGLLSVIASDNKSNGGPW